MKKLKTTFITTIYNEEKTIIPFLESLFAQTQIPDEIIIVDAGSTDKTVDLISSFLPSKQKKYKIKLIFQKGNRSVGRNAAIAKATNPIILCSDAGCILNKNWVKEITLPFKDASVDVVSGFYKPVAHNVFQKCLATYTSVMPDKIDKDTFLPSSRSVAFKKSAWEKAGGYPEYLNTCEDLVFDKKLKKINATFVFAQKAFVYWPQRKNMFEAIKQFYLYAVGDGEAHYFRKQTPLLYLRYIFGTSLLSLGFLFQKNILLESFIVLLIFYILWSIGKNYKYVNETKALFWLPVLQITSDFTVMAGTIIGFIKSLKLYSFFLSNKAFIFVLAIYVFIVIRSITWGIPNASHPFSYHMDEWAQAQAIRALFRHGTPNISGSSHGAILQYFLGGIYLIPFILLHLVNPFVIKSSLEHIDMQQRLFIILRTNTLLNGIGATALIAYIGKKFFTISKWITAFLFIFSPIFLLLSEFFKYDIALVFWISLSLLFSFIFAHNPTKRNFLFLTAISSLTVCIKLSALAMLPILVAIFFIFFKNSKKNLFFLFKSMLLFGAVFCIAGIPDLLLGIGDYKEWLRANLLVNPQSIAHNVTFSYWQFVFFTQQYPALFGHAFYIVFVFSFLFLLINLFFKFLNKHISLHDRLQSILFISTFFFAISLLSLGIEANGNRMLVFLPYAVLIIGIFLTKLKKRSSILFYSVIVLIVVFQTTETLSWLSIRYFPTPRETTSIWIEKNIPPKSTIAIENVPIFQGEPNILLKDYYETVYYPNKKTQYSYTVIDSKTTKFPKYVIISDLYPSLAYFKNSDKKIIYENLQIQKYKQIAVFYPNFSYYLLFNTIQSFFFSGIFPTPVSISVFYK